MNIVSVTSVLIGFGLILQVSHAQAQPKSILDKTIFADYGDRFFADAFVVPGNNPDSANVVVFFRLSNDFLTFVKNTDRSDVGGNYKAPVVISIEVRDTLGVIRRRIRWENTAYTNTFEETNSKNTFHYGWQQIEIAAGSYSISLEIIEKKENPQKKIKLNDVSFKPRTMVRLLTQPMFAQSVISKGRDLYRPFVLSGDVSFGSKDAVAFVLLADSTPTKYHFVVRQLPYDGRTIRWWEVSDVQGTVVSSTSRMLHLSEYATTTDPYVEVVDVKDKATSVALAEIPIPVTAMVPGQYVIELVADGTVDTLRSAFRIIWEMMPLSLRNLDYAIGALKYIATKEELSSLDSGSDADRRSRLMQWWRKQDPTPTTTYNERLAEYYKRFDQAYYAFSTIQEQDGAHSERGKIYVLFGPPTSINKKLDPNNQPQEIWTYSNSVAKTFTFGIDDRGIYKLKEVTPN